MRSYARVRTWVGVTALAMLAGACSHGGAVETAMPSQNDATMPAITAADLKERLLIFADDSMLGRRGGSIGNMKGTAYIEAQVRRMGLVPAGDNGTYFQAVPLVTRTLAQTANLNVDGAVFAPFTDFLALGAGAGAVRPFAGTTAIYAGARTARGHPREHGQHPAALPGGAARLDQ